MEAYIKEVSSEESIQIQIVIKQWSKLKIQYLTPSPTDQLKIHNHSLVFKILNLNLQALKSNSQVAKMAIFGYF